VIDLQNLDTLDAEQLRDAVRTLAKEVHFKQATIDNMDLAAVAAEIEALQPPTKAAGEKKQPKRQALPPHLPRREIRHEPESTTCGCGTPMKRIGEDVAEKLDYEPGVFTVERHVRGKWACACCEKLVQAPVAPHVIDKGLPTTGLLAQVLVAKYLGAKWRAVAHSSAARSGDDDHDRWPTRYTSGWSSTVRRCPTARPPPRPSATA